MMAPKAPAAATAVKAKAIAAPPKAKEKAAIAVAKATAANNPTGPRLAPDWRGRDISRPYRLPRPPSTIEALST